MPSAFNAPRSRFNAFGVQCFAFNVQCSECRVFLASGFLEVSPDGSVNAEADTFPPVAHKGYVAAVFLDSDVGFIWTFFSEVQDVGLWGRKNHICTG